MLTRKYFAVLLLTLSAFAQAATEEPASSEKLPWEADPPAVAAYARAALIAELGRQLFFDPGLSASGRQSCSTCHDAAAAFGPANDLPVQAGGRRLERMGTRAAPSLAYMTFVPSFTEHFYESEDDGDESLDQGPAGGRNWDGRVNRARDQAAIPLLAANEMANVSEAAVVAHAAAAPYAESMRRLYGAGIFRDTHRAFLTIGESLETFQELPELFSPYSSKYDAFLRGQSRLTESETRGLAAFNDPTKGNCASCHKSELTPARNLPRFTDFGFVALGVPRNESIPANADPNYFDLGVCGPLRKDLEQRAEFCGMFRAPTLRNVALRRSFYHNGIFHTLREAVAFYATRDTNPERWYPVGRDGKVEKFNDLPAKYRANIEAGPPFNRHPGEAPAISEDDITDIVAFLGTLTDGLTAPAQRAFQIGSTLPVRRNISAQRTARTAAAQSATGCSP